MSKKFLVALSGGVDSAVSALLIKNLSQNIDAVFMYNWSDNSFDCAVYKDMADAAFIANKLDINFKIFHFEKTYFEKVFKPSLEKWKIGYTPNPDLLCNKHIKGDILIKKAKKLGYNFIVMGHYARVEKDFSKLRLKRGLDENKDQSYFLASLPYEMLKYLIFPLGKYYKKEVKNIASLNQLLIKDRKESMGLCFLGKKKFNNFLIKFLKTNTGKIIDLNGNFIDYHNGLHFYTVGQRKGLKINNLNQTYYVLAKLYNQNHLVIGNKKYLQSSYAIASKPIWLLDNDINLPINLEVQFRHRQKPLKVKLSKNKDESIKINLLDNTSVIVAGQSAVFYDGDICLGTSEVLFSELDEFVNNNLKYKIKC